MRSKKQSVYITTLGIIFLVQSGLVWAGPIIIEKVADTGTEIPGGTGHFTGFLPPSLDGGKVAFWGAGPSNQRGIYLHVDGSLAAVVDTQTAGPGGVGTFTNIGAAALRGSTIAFIGSGSGVPAGIYTRDASGRLSTVADTNTAMPGGTGTFTGFGEFAFGRTGVAFTASGLVSGGRGVLRVGVYTDAGGPLSVVADQNTPIPGYTENFGRFAGVAFDEGTVGFGAGGGGIYTYTDGLLSVVADPNTTIPGGDGTFSRIGVGEADAALLSISGGNVAFWAADAAGEPGIYALIDGTLGVVADWRTLVPGGAANFTYFRTPALDGTDVAFVGSTRLQSGLYIKTDGVLTMVIEENDTLDGRTVSFVSIGQDALDANRLAFRTFFTDGTEGIYIATVPEPATLVLLALGAATLLRRRR